MEEKTFPKIIYHYTTQDGLIGIIKESTLWATKIHYMNDASELTEPLRMADVIITKLLQQLDIGDTKDKESKKDIYLRMLDDIRGWERINICVASFCADGDLLSQWRGYGVPGSAYSIGFDVQKLVETLDPYLFKLYHCQYYDPKAFQQKIQQFIFEVLNEAITDRKIPVDFIDKFVEMAATMKFNCFKEEDEWRVLSWRPLPFTDERFNFKSGKSMVVPYYSIPLDLSSIVEIIIGPCQHPELARDAVYGMAHKYKLENVQRGQVKTSQIPYRSF